VRTINPVEYLSEWIIRFEKNKDLILKRMIDIGHNKEEDLVIANLEKGGKQAYLIDPFLDEKQISTIFERLKGYENCSLVVYNTKDNFDVIVDNWEKFVGFKRNFSISFINPFSRTDKRWVVYPATHSLVTDDSKTKQSLKILFSNVEATTKEDVERIVSSS